MEDSDDSASNTGPVHPADPATEAVAGIAQFLKRNKGKKARKSTSQKDDHDSDEGGPMGPFLTAARWIPVSIDPFINLPEVFYEGTRARTCRPSERSQMTIDQQYKCIVFQKIMELVPNFLSIVSEFHNDMITYNLVLSLMAKKMSTTRSNVMSTLKRNIATYISPDEASRPAFVIPDFRLKTTWGWGHDVTARLLCPMRLVAEFDKDPATFREDIQRGQHRVTAADLPVFLYDELKYNPNNPLTGLLKGYVLLRGYRSIFTGPASWLTGEGEGGKQARGIVYKLKAPTPQTIAYAAVMIRWALSSAEGWEAKNFLFDYNKFFQNILMTLNADIAAEMDTEEVDASTARWIAETLGWWKTNVPALHKNNTTNIVCDEVEDMESDIFKLRASQKGRLSSGDEDSIDPSLRSSAQEPPASRESLAPPSSPPASPGHEPEDEDDVAGTAPPPESDAASSEGFRQVSVPQSRAPASSSSDVSHQSNTVSMSPTLSSAPTSSKRPSSSSVKATTVPAAKPANQTGFDGDSPLSSPAPPKAKRSKKRDKAPVADRSTETRSKTRSLLTKSTRTKF